MNNYTRSIASIMRYNVTVRDTLEYALRKDDFAADFFAYKKKILRVELEQNTPLKVCLANSGQAGKDLLDRLQEMIETIYGDASTIVQHGSDNTLRVDYAQRLTVFKLVIPIHDEISKIILAHINGAKKAEMYDDRELERLLAADELFYRGFAFMLMLDELDRLFAEYNKARQEAKGAITPQSNFIQNDIQELIRLMSETRSNARMTSNDYYEVVDPLFALIEMTSGRRDLPAGKNFAAMFTDVKALVRAHVLRWETAWKRLYEPFVRRYIEDAKQYQKDQAAGTGDAMMNDKGGEA